jgi:5-methylcytosine-specific restriction endonuclease McrA
MTSNSVNPLIRKAAEQVKSKRARAVIDFILKHGLVTTEDIEKMGYAHPPRAVRDVRENGIPLDTVRVKGVNGKSIAAYKFGDPAEIQSFKLGGRKTFSKQFKTALLEKQGGRCAICNEEYDDKYLQIDHRVPYELSGDSKTLDIKDFMLLCAECNRKKDRATELGCRNTCFKTNDLSIIRSCFWASPENYAHICMEQIRRIDLAWKGEEVSVYDNLKSRANSQNKTLQDFVKQLLGSVE